MTRSLFATLVVFTLSPGMGTGAHALDACFEPDRKSSHTGYTFQFDASCSTPAEEIVSYAWDFGDGSSAVGRAATREYSGAGSYTVTLTVEDAVGGAAQTTRAVHSHFEVFHFLDRFNSDLGQWWIRSGDWRIENKRLAVAPSDDAALIWAGYENEGPTGFGYTHKVEFDIEFTGDGARRSAGVVLFGTNEKLPASGNCGYTVLWSNDGAENGYSITAWDAGQSEVVAFAPAAEPAGHWYIEIDDFAVRLRGDFQDVLVADHTFFRAGSIGLLNHGGGGTVHFDSFEVNEREVPPPRMRRGDVDDDGQATITDAIKILLWLFADPNLEICLETADFDNDSVVNISDPLGFLNFLFAGGDPPDGGSECQEIFDDETLCEFQSCF